MIIYNSGNLDHNSRFILSIVLGTLAAIGLGIAYGLVQSIVRFEMEIMYVFIGYLIARLIREIGHGVTQKFAILGAVLTFIAIIVGDIIVAYGLSNFFIVLFNPNMWLNVFQIMIISRLSSLWGMLGVLFRIMGIYTAYQQSRIF